MAKKTLEDMLRENTRRPEAPNPARRLATFLALWDEIQEAYKNGWSYKDIWKALDREEVIDFGYSSFLHFIQKRNRRLREAERAAGVKMPVPAKPEGQGSASPASTVPGSTRVDMPRFGVGLPPRDPKKF